MRSRVGVVLPPSKLKERRRRARTVGLVAWTLLAGLACAGFVGFFYIPALTIRDIQIDGADTVPVASVRQRVEESLSGKRYVLFPARNAFVYSDTAVATDLTKTFPKLDVVRVSLENFHSIRVTVTERTPFALFCGTSIEMPQNPCFFIDAHGVAYEAAPDFSDNAYVRWYGDDALSLGDQYLSEDVFRSVSALVAAFRSVKLEPVAVYVDAIGDVSVTSQGKLEVRFTLARKPEEVLRLLKAALSSEALAGKEFSAIAYIDLRFGNRLYYKIR